VGPRTGLDTVAKGKNSFIIELIQGILHENLTKEILYNFSNSAFLIGFYQILYFSAVKLFGVPDYTHMSLNVEQYQLYNISHDVHHVGYISIK